MANFIRTRPGERLNLKQKELAARVAIVNWNKKYPVGTKVNVKKDNGEVLNTVTRSAADVIGCMAVIWVEGIAGCYSLDRVTAVLD